MPKALPPDPLSLPVPDEVRAKVAALVERYEQNADQYKSTAYNEAQCRQDFIDPFFEALGWDVRNTAGYAEQYREVVQEPTLKTEEATRAPDYCFRIGGMRKFYVEAKKPSVRLHEDVGPAYQVRRYAWSAKLPLSILTDFEEFAVYDCRRRPAPQDKASVGRVRFLTYRRYLDELGYLYSTFSREAVLKGSFDRYAEDRRHHRGTAEVDAAFLAEIEGWRDALARDIANHNKGLSVDELNFAVQATIERILFFRIAEDRGVEVEGRLRAIAEASGGTAGSIYRNLCRLYHEADAKYNSGLFDFGKSGDTLSPRLTVSDKVLKPILKGLYYPQCPYEFSVIGADILGAVYEQFLGKVIRLTPSGMAKVEEKPEVKKAGGVYYTPTYIVDYIVKHTVEEAANEAGTPEKVAKLRVLDPACGSGSFLLGAYECLLQWHLRYYVEHGAAKYARGKDPALVQVGERDWRLSTTERKRILLNNLYGVDIDRQAVEVTKLNLLLKCMEGDVWPGLVRDRKLIHDRVLPNIDGNIKCGNSLIGPDYFADHLVIDPEEERRVNPFDWPKEFPAIMQAGGFDCVIGNPPYLSFSGRQKPEGFEPSIAYWKARYPWDAWPTSHGLFLLRATDLRREGGCVAMIVPDQVGHLKGYGPLRARLMERCGLVEARYWGENVFSEAVTPSLTVILRDPGQGRARIVGRKGATADASLACDEPWTVRRNPELMLKIASAGVSLGESVRDPGVHTGNCSAKLILPIDAIAPAGSVPVLEGKQVGRYCCAPPRKVLNLSYAPLKGEYFRIGSGDAYESAQYVIRQTAPYVIVGPKTGATYFRNSLLALYAWEPHDQRYVVGVLNSKVTRFAYEEMTVEAGQSAFPQVKVGSVRALPIRPIDFTDPSDVARHDKMVGLVERMLDLHKRLPEAKTQYDRELIERRIQATDEEIDRLVYELYGLTEEEIAIVEGET